MKNARYAYDPYNADAMSDADPEHYEEGEQYAGAMDVIRRILKPAAKTVESKPKGVTYVTEYPGMDHWDAKRVEAANEEITADQAKSRLEEMRHSGAFGDPVYIPGAEGAYAKYPASKGMPLPEDMPRFEYPWVSKIAEYYNSQPAEQMPYEVAKGGNAQWQIANARMADPWNGVQTGEVLDILKRQSDNATRYGVDRAIVDAEKARRAQEAIYRQHLDYDPDQLDLWGDKKLPQRDD